MPLIAHQSLTRVRRVIGEITCLALLLTCVFASGQSNAPSTNQSPAHALPDAPLGTATISGTVTDATGALIAGASVTLKEGSLSRATTSSSDGSFTFTSVPAGAFQIDVSLQGFSNASLTGSVNAGEMYAAPPLSMKMGEVDVSVNALTQKQLAQLQVHAEEQQRVLGLLPNFFVAYDWKAVPLTPKQKFSLVATTFRDPINIIIAAGSAGVQQWQNDFAGYGQGAQGYGKRFGANYGNLVVGTVLGGGVFPVLFHQDPRYFYKGTGSVHSRLFYALSTAIICRGDNGKRQFAIAGILGDFSAGAISNAYYPSTDRSGTGVTLENGLIGIGGDAVGNVFQEFIVRKFTPKSRRGVINSVTTESQQH